jgi:hypothetical protein
MEREQVAQLWVDALRTPTEDTAAAVADVLADGVVTASPTGAAEGKPDVVAALSQSPLASYFAQAAWSQPTASGDSVEVTGTFPVQAPVGGVTLQFAFDDAGKISRVETSLLPAPPPTPTKIEITEEMTAAVNGALTNRNPITVAYVDPDGQPHISFRGTTQVFGSDQLAIWIRNPEGGLVSAIETFPRLALFYRDPATRATYQFLGRAHVDRSQQTIDTVYSNSPEPERNMDLQRRGVAVVVTLDRIEGRDASGGILMTRDAS